MSYSTLADIRKQATKDLGFKVEMSGWPDHPGLTNRMVNDPKSIDRTWNLAKQRSRFRRA
jgi:hypothetical protein